MGGGLIVDKVIDWARKRKYWSVHELGMMITGAHTADETFNEGEILSAPRDEANVFLLEISDYGIVGFQIAAADDDDGQLCYGYTRCPNDLDPTFPVGFKIHWTQSAAVTVGVTFKLEIGTTLVGAAIKAEDGLTVLDTVIAESNAGGAWYNQMSPRGIKNSIGLTRAQIEAGAMLSFGFEADVIDATIVNCTLLGLEMDYIPIKCEAQGSEPFQPLTTHSV